MSLRPTRLTRANEATFCQALPDGINIMTWSHLYRSCCAVWSAFSKSGKFHRAIDEKALNSDGSGDFGMEGYSLCRIRFSEVCH